MYVCFFGFLRSGEITIPSVSAYDASTHLSPSDISADVPSQPTVVQLRLKQSKTDPFRQGVNIYLGATNCTLCPVTALLNFLAISGQADGPRSNTPDQAKIHKQIQKPSAKGRNRQFAILGPQLSYRCCFNGSCKRSRRLPHPNTRPLEILCIPYLRSHSPQQPCSYF